jgi:predicted transcriptional regulator
MARVSIYVPDDLKARMDRIGEAANWSEVVRPAILSEVANREHRKGANMATVVERLRASKEKYLKEAEHYGLEAGRKWASDKAEYYELVQVANYWETSRWDVDLDGLRLLIDPNEELTTEEFYDVVGCKGFEESNEFAEGFAHGAQEVFEEVADEIDKQ